MLTQRSKRGYWGDRVGPDNEAVGRLAAEYLTSNGHTSLAQLTLTGSHLGFCLRNEAFAETAEVAGASVESIALEGHTNEHDQVDEDYIDEVVERILSLRPRPTGVFVPREPHHRALPPSPPRPEHRSHPRSGARPRVTTTRSSAGSTPHRRRSTFARISSLIARSSSCSGACNTRPTTRAWKSPSNLG